MKDWQRIRHERTDLTDYVIHFTKDTPIVDEYLNLRSDGYMTARRVFVAILNDGFIRPTFAPIRNKTIQTVNNTVRGPYPAVCLTEQPLSAVLTTLRCSRNRYSGFGIAYHKYALTQAGGNPVLYGDGSIIGRWIRRDEPGYEEGKDIYTGGLPPELQYLWVRYKPASPQSEGYPIDFTWEREWRVKCGEPGLPVFLEKYERDFTPELPAGALIVEKDEQVPKLRQKLAAKAEAGVSWAGKFSRIVSLETVERKLGEGDHKYARIETWPE